MEVAQQIRYFVAVDRLRLASNLASGVRSRLRLASNLAFGVGSRLQLASASVVCVFVFIWGRLGVGCRQWAASEGGYGWWVSGRVRWLAVGCRQWAVDAAVLRVLLLMCYLCVFL